MIFGLSVHWAELAADLAVSAQAAGRGQALAEAEWAVVLDLVA